MDPSPNANVPIDTVLFEPTFLLAIVPVPDKLKVCEPTKLACVAKSDATAFVVASYKRVPLTPTTRRFTVKLCVPPVNV